VILFTKPKLTGGIGMKELTREEILEPLCAPAHTDEPEKSDFADGGEIVDEEFIARYRKELN
jgi:hypothetical protein